MSPFDSSRRLLFYRLFEQAVASDPVTFAQTNRDTPSRRRQSRPMNRGIA